MEANQGKGLMKRIVASLCFPSLLKRAIKKAWLIGCCSTSPQVKEGVEVKLSAEGNEIICEDVEILSSESYRADKLNIRGSEEVSNLMTLQDGSQDDERNTQGVEVCSTLPEDLVERILAMVPFPYVFKARALSTSWLARFSPVESQADEVKKHLATSFQKRVSESSTNWKTLCPVFVDSLKGFSAYDRAAGRWARMPPLSFIPCHLLNSPYLQMDGALLLMSEFYESESGSRGSCRHELCVANVLTRSLRRLPRPPPVLCTPEDNCTSYFQKLLSQTSLGTYKVVIIYISRARGYYLAQIYDSKSNAWRSRTLAKNVPGLTSPLAYLNGVLYMVVGENPTHLLALNVEEGAFQELEMSGDTIGKVAVGLVVCNAHLLMFVKESCFGRAGGQVLQIDLRLRRLVEVGRGPALKHCVNTLLSDGNCVLLPFSDGPADSSANCNCNGMLVYNLRENKWNSVRFHWQAKCGLPNHQGVFSFQPNLNTFMAV